MRAFFAVAVALLLGGAGAQAGHEPAAAVQSLQELLDVSRDAPEEELLEPEKAFAVRVLPNGPDALIVEYTAAEGYYLYHDKFGFAAESPGVTLGEAQIPPGKIKVDEFFGEVQTHRGLVRIDLPLRSRPAAASELSLALRSQGCADIGVCYPPLTQRVALQLPPAGGGTGSASALDALGELTRALGVSAGDDELLDPEQAYLLRVDDSQPGELLVAFDIAEGYYLYLDKMGFALETGDGLTLGAPRFSETKIKEDEFFGRMAVFYGRAEARIPVLGDPAPRSARLQVRYQGCAEELGVCYPPMAKTLRVNLAGAALAAAAGAAGPAAAVSGDGPPRSEQDRIAASLASNGVWLTILAFFGLGLLLTFTPCVLPMVPILSGIIAGQGADIGARRAFALSLTYVLAMALTYTIAGVLVGLSGENIQALFQDPWILSVFAALFVLLSLSMFGFYELQMPGAIQSRLATISHSQRGGTYASVAIMGTLSALIVGPCVTAPLVGALIYIAQTGDAVLGGVALFALSMGMGVPLLVVGTSAGKYLPKAGPWMDAIKAVFGVLLLGVAVWLLERILPTAVTMSLWAALLIVSAIYLGALEPIPAGAGGWPRLWKGVGLISLLAGVLLLIGAAGGGSSVLQPLRGMTGSGPGAAGSAQAVHFVQVKGLAGVQREIARANAANRTVMLDFYADWCISCKEMEAFTFSDREVQAALANTVLLQADVTPNDEQDRELLKHFGLFGPPAILFFDLQGREQRNQRVVGFMNAPRFRDQVLLALN